MAPKKRSSERSRRHDRPRGASTEAAAAAAAADAAAWEQFTAPDGRVYYFNQVRRLSGCSFM